MQFRHGSCTYLKRSVRSDASQSASCDMFGNDRLKPALEAHFFIGGASKSLSSANCQWIHCSTVRLVRKWVHESSSRKDVFTPSTIFAMCHTLGVTRLISGAWRARTVATFTNLNDRKVSFRNFESGHTRALGLPRDLEVELSPVTVLDQRRLSGSVWNSNFESVSVCDALKAESGRDLKSGWITENRSEPIIAIIEYCNSNVWS